MPSPVVFICAILVLIVAAFSTWWFMLRKTYCATNGVFPKTLKGQTATTNCPAGYTGTQSAQCKSDGKFSAANTSNCVANPTQCAANSSFPTTAVGETGFAPCPAGYLGTQKALCKSDGTFAANDMSACVPQPAITSCPAAGNLPLTAVGGTVSKPCPAGYVGNMTSVCKADGEFASDMTSCRAVLTPSSKTTKLATQNGGQGALAAHSVECPMKSGLSGFALQRTPPDIQMKSDCQTSPDIGLLTSLSTPLAANLWEASVDVKCPPKHVLNQWQVTNPGKLSIDYKCAAMPTLNEATCTDKTTNWDLHANGYSIYLDRQAVSCPANTMLTRIKLENDGVSPEVGTKQRFKYTCCGQGA